MIELSIAGSGRPILFNPALIEAITPGDGFTTIFCTGADDNRYAVVEQPMQIAKLIDFLRVNGGAAVRLKPGVPDEIERVTRYAA